MTQIPWEKNVLFSLEFAMATLHNFGHLFYFFYFLKYLGVSKVEIVSYRYRG